MTGGEFILILCGMLLTAFVLPWLIHWWQRK